GNHVVTICQNCANPGQGISALSDFLGLDPAEISDNSLLKLIQVPDSIGRFKSYDTTIFSEDDMAYVKELGFDTGEQEH
ncbi:MAG: hypothetical protein ACKVKR_01410, partial [Pseudomonadales bacterium]